jgi:hypothetical protein
MKSIWSGKPTLSITRISKDLLPQGHDLVTDVYGLLPAMDVFCGRRTDVYERI